MKNTVLRILKNGSAKSTRYTLEDIHKNYYFLRNVIGASEVDGVSEFYCVLKNYFFSDDNKPLFEEFVRVFQSVKRRKVTDSAFFQLLNTYENGHGYGIDKNLNRMASTVWEFEVRFNNPYEMPSKGIYISNAFQKYFPHAFNFSQENKVNFHKSSSENFATSVNDHIHYHIDYMDAFIISCKLDLDATGFLQGIKSYQEGLDNLKNKLDEYEGKIFVRCNDYNNATQSEFELYEDSSPYAKTQEMEFEFDYEKNEFVTL